MSETIRIGLELVEAAVETRRQITERYKTYGVLNAIVQSAASTQKPDFKAAVDALYYLGGGWPTPNSKGRMEAALDHLAGMYRLLTFIGEGNLVEEHLANYGITIRITNPLEDSELSPNDLKFLNEQLEMEQFGWKPKTVRELVQLCVNEAMDLQKFICQNADEIKHNLKPGAKDALQVEDEEYDRIVFLTKSVDKPDTVVKKKNKIAGSVESFQGIVKVHV